MTKNKKAVISVCAVGLAAILAVGVVAGVTDGFKDFSKNPLKSDETKIAEFLEGPVNFYDAEIKTIGANLFCLSLYEGYPLLETIDCPRVETVGMSAFFEADSLKSANFPRLNYLGDSAFYRCSALTEVNMPNVNYIGSSAFGECEKLTTANVSGALTVGDSAFACCSSLKSLCFSNAVSFGEGVFFSCSQLERLELRSMETVHFAADLLSDTPIAAGTGYIYVPDGKVEDYKTLYKDYASQIKGLSELPDESADSGAEDSTSVTSAS